MSKVSAKIESAAQTDSVTLIDNASNKSVELPLLHGTEGPKVVDIRRLYAETGFFTFGPSEPRSPARPLRQACLKFWKCLAAKKFFGGSEIFPTS